MIDELHTGGIEKIAIQQVGALKRIGKKAGLIVLRRVKIEAYPYAEFLKNTPVIYLDDRLPRWFKFSFKIPFFSYLSLFHLTYPLFLPWVVGKKEFTVLVSHGTYTTFTALTLKFFKGIPFFVFIWDPIYYILKKAYVFGPIRIFFFVLLPLARFFDRLIVTFSNGVFVAGSPHLNYLKSVGASRIIKLYPGVEPIDKLPDKKEKFILSVTGWTQAKKPDYNLELIRALPSSHLIMAGSWYPKNSEEDFRQKVKDERLTDRVEITGALEENKLRRLYQEALVLLQTNDDRGFGLPALEAAAHGCTFIIPQGQGVGELFEDKVDGFFTKERDTKVILEKLKLLIGDPKLARRMGESAWTKVANSYSWEKHAQKLSKEVERLFQ